MPYLTISLFNWRELMSVTCVARLTLPLLLFTAREQRLEILAFKVFDDMPAGFCQ